MTDEIQTRRLPVTGPAFYKMSGPELLDYCGADARKWAEAFCRIKEMQGWGAADIDEGLMIGWFANAIEHSEQVRLGPAQSPDTRVREALEAVVSVSQSGADTVSFLVELQRVAKLCASALAALPQPGAVEQTDTDAIDWDEIAEIRLGQKAAKPPALDPATVERCAKFIEQNQESDGEDGKYLSPRIKGNQLGLSYAAAIRALASPVPSTVRVSNKEAADFINKRLEDLAEANALYGKDQRLNAPDKIARNDREISWLKDLRSMITLTRNVAAETAFCPRCKRTMPVDGGGEKCNNAHCGEPYADLLDGHGNVRIKSADPVSQTHTTCIDEMIETACAAYAKATNYYVEFHRGLSSPSADSMRKGMRAALDAVSLHDRVGSEK